MWLRRFSFLLAESELLTVHMCRIVIGKLVKRLVIGIGWELVHLVGIILIPATSYQHLISIITKPMSKGNSFTKSPYNIS